MDGRAKVEEFLALLADIPHLALLVGILYTSRYHFSSPRLLGYNAWS
jgi:hypothetical protein